MENDSVSLMPVIKISNLDKYFGRLHVLKDISLEVQPREVVCIIGRSGSGKSTLLRCINFLEEPSHGTIEVDGVKVAASLNFDYKNKLLIELTFTIYSSSLDQFFLYPLPHR